MRTINKSSMVRDAFAEMGLDASPTAVAEALAAKGVQVRTAMISNIKSELRANRAPAGRPKASKSTVSTSKVSASKVSASKVSASKVSASKVSVDALMKAKVFVDKVGSIDAAKQLVAVLDKVL